MFLEDFLAGAEYFVQRFLKMCRRAREVCSNLRYVLFVALFDLIAEEFLERSFLESFSVLRRIISNHVRNEGARQTLGAETRITSEKRIDRTPACGL